jgi:hypothetical protein
LRLLALLLAGAALAACGTSPKSDWEREHAAELAKEKEKEKDKKDDVVLPPYPHRPELLEFRTAPTSAFRFFVDGPSISVEEGVVRYILFAKSEQGAQNVSYEGLRCASSEVKIYAVGRDGKWSGKPTDWRSLLPWHRVLAAEYFCPLQSPIRSRKEGIYALQRGGHPFHEGLTGDIPRGGGAR